MVPAWVLKSASLALGLRHAWAVGTAGEPSDDPFSPLLAPGTAWCESDGLGDWRTVAATANATSWEIKLPVTPFQEPSQEPWQDAGRATWGVWHRWGFGGSRAGHGDGAAPATPAQRQRGRNKGKPTVGVVMQVTEGIGGYASPFVALAASWCRERGLPLAVYGPLPLEGCDERHPTPPGRDERFGKVWLLAHAMREIVDARQRDAEMAAQDTGGSSEPRSYPEWLLWLDSDVLILDGHGLGGDGGPDWLERVLLTYGEEGTDATGLSPATCRAGTRHEVALHYEELQKAAAPCGGAGTCPSFDASPLAADSSPSLRGVDLIVADQRDSLFGDTNAGTILVRVCDWSLAFLEAWWEHKEAEEGAYEQLVFQRLWAADSLGVRSSHAALVPMHAMNSHPGPWWPAGGRAAAAPASAASDTADTAEYSAGAVSSASGAAAAAKQSPVLHLMQRAEVVRREVGLKAVERLCDGKPLLLASRGKPPKSDAAGEVEGADWVFAASLGALVDAAARLFAASASSVSNVTSSSVHADTSARHDDGDAGRVLLDLLMVLQKPGSATIATASNGGADDAGASSWTDENDDDTSTTGTGGGGGAVAAAASPTWSNEAKAGSGLKAGALATVPKKSKTAARPARAASGAHKGPEVVWSGAALERCARHRGARQHPPRDASESVNDAGSESLSRLIDGYRTCLLRASDPSVKPFNAERAAFETAAVALLRERWDGPNRGGAASGSESRIGALVRDEIVFLEQLASSQWAGGAALPSYTSSTAVATTSSALSSLSAEGSSSQPSSLLQSLSLGVGSSVGLWRRAHALRSAHLPSLHRFDDPPAAASELASCMAGLAQALLKQPFDPARRSGVGEADGLLRKAVRVREQALSTQSHPDVAGLQLALAQLLEDHPPQGGGSLAEPLALTRVATNCLERHLGPTHPWHAAGLHRLGALLYKMGRSADAESVHRRALALREAADANAAACGRFQGQSGHLGEGVGGGATEEAEARGAGVSVAVAASLNALGELLRLKGDPPSVAEAIAFNRRAVAIFERAFGGAHHHVALATNNLGLSLQAAGTAASLEESLGLLLKAAGAWASVHGDEGHPQVALSRNNAAATLWMLGRHDQALPVMRSALAVLERSYGRGHPLVRSMAVASAMLARGEPFPRSDRSATATKMPPAASEAEVVVAKPAQGAARSTVLEA